MKTKVQTKQRKQERDFDVAMRDCKKEFGHILLPDFILEEVTELELVEDDE